jgi:2-keto-3-deoxy-L-rhamnonate aldolase RhmA
MRINKLKQTLESGGVALGAALGFNSPDTVELLGTLGVDYVVFDIEHEVFNELSLLHSLRTAEAAGVTTICRLPNDPDLILRVLDAGAQCIHVGRVNTADDVQDIVAAARFYPVGDRSFFAEARSGDYGIGVTEEEFAEFSNHETLITVEIEEKEAAENIGELLALPGIDIMQVGLKHLWHSMGMPDRSESQIIADQAIHSAREAGKWVSSYIWLNDTFEQQVDRLTRLGVQMLTASARDFIIEGTRGFLSLKNTLNSK